MPEKNIKQIVRIFNADLDGSKPVQNSLTKIRGISFMFANAICNAAHINKKLKVGELNQTEIDKITNIIKTPEKFKIPYWLFNRRKDYNSNEDRHITGTDLKFQTDQDIKYMKKIKCYKGIRHSIGLPVRGQRTRSNFRHGKTIGVRKKGIMAAAKKPAEAKKEKK